MLNTEKFDMNILQIYPPGACYRRSACTDTDELRLVAAACCTMGWISALRGVLCDWSVSTKKTGSIYQCKRWLLWKLAVTLFAWHFSWHTSQPLLFRATDDNAQLALFRAPNVWRNTTDLHQDEKSFCFSQVSVAILLGVMAKWVTVCFLLR